MSIQAIDTIEIFAIPLGIAIFCFALLSWFEQKEKHRKQEARIRELEEKMEKLEVEKVIEYDPVDTQ